MKAPALSVVEVERQAQKHGTLVREAELARKRPGLAQARSEWMLFRNSLETSLRFRAIESYLKGYGK